MCKLSSTTHSKPLSVFAASTDLHPNVLSQSFFWPMCPEHNCSQVLKGAESQGALPTADIHSLPAGSFESQKHPTVCVHVSSSRIPPVPSSATSHTASQPLSSPWGTNPCSYATRCKSVFGQCAPAGMCGRLVVSNSHVKSSPSPSLTEHHGAPSHIFFCFFCPIDAQWSAHDMSTSIPSVARLPAKSFHTDSAETWRDDTDRGDLFASTPAMRQSPVTPTNAGRTRPRVRLVISCFSDPTNEREWVSVK